MAIQPLKFQADLQKFGDSRVVVAFFTQLRFPGNRLGQGYRIGWIIGNQAAKPVDLAIRHLQYPANIAKHRTRLELAKGDNLRDPVVTIFLANIIDYLIATFGAEIDIEIRHRNTFGVQKSFEQQAKPQRVEIGNCKHPGNQRTSTRPAPGAHRNILALGPFDDIGDDQEISWKLHFGDDAQLVGQPVPISLLIKPWCRAVNRQTGAQACL